MSIKLIWNHGHTVIYKFGRNIHGVTSDRKRPDIIEVSIIDIFSSNYNKETIIDYLYSLLKATNNKKITLV